MTVSVPSGLAAMLPPVGTTRSRASKRSAPAMPCASPPRPVRMSVSLPCVMVDADGMGDGSDAVKVI